MLELKNISFKNFLSVGNKPMKYELNKYQNTCIIGKNGHGKSLIADAITFALFGKGFRKINKGQLVNTINGEECVVTLELEHNGKEYVITRGIKPNVFDITVDGEQRRMLSSLKDEQQWLETNLQLNYKTFIHVVILGNCNYVPFMEKSASERRNFIEDTLGLTEYSNMKVVTKDKIKTVLSEIKDINKDIATVESTEKILNNSIEKLEKVLKQQKDDTDKKIKSIQDEIDQHKKELSVFIKDRTILQKKLDDMGDPHNAHRKLERKRNNLVRDKSNMRDDIVVYKNNDSCPTCQQKLTDSFVTKKLSEIKDRVLEIQQDIDVVDTLLEENENIIRKYNKLVADINELNNQERLAQSNISYKEKHLKSLEAPVETVDDLDNMKNDLEQYRTQKALLYETLEEQEKQKELLEKILDSYEPVKQKTIDTYIPAINSYLNRYLKILGLDATFKFDTEFKEIISTKYKEEYSYTSFSEGEKMRINLALLLTWREIGKMKNSFNCNLLILDEVCDSSLDVDGMASFLELVRQLHGNVFIISHREEVVTENFDNVVKITKRRVSTMEKV